MPWKSEWVDAAVFLTHNGITIYCTYKNEDIDSGPSSFFFTTDPASTEGCDSVFDVRDLPTWTAPPHPPFLSGENDTPQNRAAWQAHRESDIERTHVCNALSAAIDRGIIGTDGRLRPVCERCGAVLDPDRIALYVHRRSGRGSGIFCGALCAMLATS